MVGLTVEVVFMEIGVVKSFLKLPANIAKSECTTGNAHMAVNVISIKYLPEMVTGIVNVLTGIN
jgi:hypothetical protein